MSLTEPVKRILGNYESDNPGTKANLARILMHGKLGGTGRLLILPVDQGVEHGPARSFAPNPPAYDPHYHYQLAVEAGFRLMWRRSALSRPALRPMPERCRPS
jgi:fructose-bisphosphate aldolase, class I